MDQPLIYNIPLPQDVNSILQEEFFMIEHVGAELVKQITEPMKFSASTWIYLRRGSCRAEINLRKYNIAAPAFVTVDRQSIMIPEWFSDDFDAAFIVFSEPFFENLFMHLADTLLWQEMSNHAVVSMTDREVPNVEATLARLRTILNDSSNPYATRALTYTVLDLLYSSLYKCYERFGREKQGSRQRMVTRFLALVQHKFKEEKMLGYYAEKLEVSPKHLSRTVRELTGFTAAEWIERFVILEAKVLLKSSNLNIQEIAENLHFASLSFFGKYFKKVTGMTPREYRNA